MTENNTLAVYAADVAPLYQAELFEAKYSCVSGYRKAKIDRMMFQKDKCLSLGAELLLMRACRDFGVNYSRQTVITGKNGKPQFAGDSVLFNLSHSGKQVLCIMSAGKAAGISGVGCDVEQICAGHEAIVKRFFTEEERAFINQFENDEERMTAFYRLWTLKESFMKCTGLGFRMGLDDFTVRMSPSGPSVVLPEDGNLYKLYESAEPGYRYSWCVKCAAGHADFSQTINRVDLCAVMA